MNMEVLIHTKQSLLWERKPAGNNRESTMQAFQRIQMDPWYSINGSIANVSWPREYHKGLGARANYKHFFGNNKSIRGNHEGTMPVLTIINALENSPIDCSWLMNRGQERTPAQALFWPWRMRPQAKAVIVMFLCMVTARSAYSGKPKLHCSCFDDRALIHIRWEGVWGSTLSIPWAGPSNANLKKCDKFMK